MAENGKLSLATNGRRILSCGIDEMVLAILFFLIYMGEFSKAANQEQLQSIMMNFIVQYYIIKVLYHTLFVYFYGATLGKFVCKIRCINQDALVPNFYESLMRAVVRIISEFAFYLGFVWAFFSEFKQTWHDKFATTLVVQVD